MSGSVPAVGCLPTPQPNIVGFGRDEFKAYLPVKIFTGIKPNRGFSALARSHWPDLFGQKHDASPEILLRIYLPLLSDENTLP
jgi:hypothetical protein